METLRRLLLDSEFTEASALLPVHSTQLLQRLGVEAAWWLVHDEAGLTNMVSLVCPTDRVTRRGIGDKREPASDDQKTRWSIFPVALSLMERLPFESGPSSNNESVVLTDAEAMAHCDGMVFVFGSGFTNQKGRLDDRRSFVARFVEEDVVVDKDTIAAAADVLEFGSGLLVCLNDALANQDIDLMELDDRAAKRLAKSKVDDEKLRPGLQPINIEGAAVIGDSLVLGLRWPVERGGHPLLAVIDGGRQALAAKEWSRDALLDCPISIQVVQEVGSKKRPAGIRAMSTSNGELHVVCGPTERGIAADRVRSAQLRHLQVDLNGGAASEVRSFKGFRKVEALAPRSTDSGWLYALDDEDAVVLVVAARPDL